MASPAPIEPVVPVITPEQQLLINQMRDKVASVYNPKRHSDEYLLRFLRARGLDVDKASEMFITSMNWRRDNGVDNILQTFPTSPYFQALINYWPSTYIGTLKTGHKAFYERLGAIEPKSLMKVFPMNQLVLYHIYVLEIQERDRRRQIKSRGYSLPFVNIQDCDGLGMKHAYMPGIEFLRTLTKIDEGNYPEMVHQIYFINTPSVFSALYKLVTPFVPQETIDKVRLDRNELLSLLPPEGIPPHLGGQMQVSIATGGTIDDTRVFPTGRRITVSKGSVHEEPHLIEMPGSVFNIHFATESNDIGFALFFKPSVHDKEATVLIPNKRYDSHQVAIHLSVDVQEPGVFITHWDNTFSTWTSKSLFYTVVVVSPVQQAQILDEVLKKDPAEVNANGMLLPKLNKQ